ncbi:MAG: hypothetical protein LBR68_06075 [Lachnoclostridium sp.]|nr:hypothetical protein [Lachnoclostridium sp.]
METLTVDELKSQIRRDSTFTEFYKQIQDIRQWLISDEISQARWGDITYKDIRKYNNHWADSTNRSDFYNRVEAEWASKYPDYSNRLDSVITYWRKYREENSVNSYVTVEFDRLDKEYYSYGGDVRSVNVGFKITPLKGTVQQLIFTYEVKAKIHSDDTGFNIYDRLNRNRCRASSPISSSRTLYWEADYSNEKQFKYATTEEIKRDYDFKIEVQEVRIDGRNLNDDNLPIPKSVDMYLKYGDLYDDDVIREVIDPNYTTLWNYVDMKFKEELNKHYPVVYSMFEAYYEYESDH